MILIVFPVVVALAVVYGFIVILYLVLEKLFLAAWAVAKWQIDASVARRLRAQRLELELPAPVVRSAHDRSAAKVWRRTDAR